MTESDIAHSLALVRAGARERQESRKEFRATVSATIAALADPLRVGDRVSVSDPADPFGPEAQFEVREVFWPVSFDRPAMMRTATFTGPRKTIARQLDGNLWVAYADPRSAVEVQGKQPGVVVGGLLYDAAHFEIWDNVPAEVPERGTIRFASHELVVAFARDLLAPMASAYAEAVTAEAQTMQEITARLRGLS